jgi:hypothetical protein
MQKILSLIFTVIMVSLLMACTGQEEQKPTDSVVTAESEQSSESQEAAEESADSTTEESLSLEEQQVLEIGESSAIALIKDIKGNLQNAMKEGGPVHAVEFCNEQALPLTDQVQENLGRGIEIKRTSFKYRNPANAPDPLEEEALRYFEEMLKENGQLPQYYTQEIAETGEHRYYKPLQAGALCLTCHGQEIDPAIEEVLAKHYPDDQAVGYQEGDFRGLVRVSMPAESLK